MHQEMSEMRPRVLPNEDNWIQAGSATPDDDESGVAQQASSRTATEVEPAIPAYACAPALV